MINIKRKNKTRFSNKILDKRLSKFKLYKWTQKLRNLIF
jgi:hypothetical protein